MIRCSKEYTPYSVFYAHLDFNFSLSFETFFPVRANILQILQIPSPQYVILQIFYKAISCSNSFTIRIFRSVRTPRLRS